MATATAKDILQVCLHAKPAKCLLRVQGSFLAKCRPLLSSQGAPTSEWRKCMRPFEDAVQAVQGAVHPKYFSLHDPESFLRKQDVEAAVAAFEGARKRRRSRRSRPRRRGR